MTIFSLILSSVVLLVGLAFYNRQTIHSWQCKRQVEAATQYLVESDSYYVMTDVVLLTFEGLIQIDFIIVSRFGVFAVAKLDYEGLIDGAESSDLWYQIVNKNEKFAFPNPSLQLKKNTETLKILIDIDKNKIFSVVLFDRISGFVSSMRSRTTHGDEYLDYIRTKRELLLTTKQIKNIVETIEAKRKKQGLVTGLKQLDTSNQIRTILDNEDVCPSCGSDMEIKVQQSGKTVGQQYLRCVLYPTCRSTKTIK